MNISTFARRFKWQVTNIIKKIVVELFKISESVKWTLNWANLMADGLDITQEECDGMEIGL